MTEPVKTFSRRLPRRRRSNELDDARRVAKHFGTDHHELELSFLDDTVDLAELVWHLDEPLADLSALGFLALSSSPPTRHRRPLRPRRRRTLRRLPKHQAAALVCALRGYPAPLRARRGRLGAPGRRHAGAPRGRSRAARPAERLLAMSGKLDDGAARGSTAARSPASTAARRARGRSTSSDGVSDDPLAATLYLDAQLGARRRHAPLLRPRLDGALPRGPRAIPRPPPRRMGSNHPATTLKVRRDTTKYVLKRSRAAALLPDWPSTSQRSASSAGLESGWFTAQTGRRRRRVPASSRVPAYGAYLDRRHRVASRSATRRRIATAVASSPC